MRKISLILLVLIVAVSMVAADQIKLYRVTFINKSSGTVYISLVPDEGGNPYYLTIYPGSPQNPYEVVFTLAEGDYKVNAWVGDDGGQCAGLARIGNGVIERQARYTIPACGVLPHDWRGGERHYFHGEPSQEKVLFENWVKDKDLWNGAEVVRGPWTYKY